MHDDENIFDKVSRDNAKNRLKDEGNVRKALTALLVSMVFSFAIFISIGHFPDSIVCSFVDNNILLYIWPPNGSIIESLDLTSYSRREKCDFIAARSIMSATLLPYLLYIIANTARSHHDNYRNGQIFPFAVLLIIGIFTSFDQISDSYSRFQLSSTSTVGVNLLKSGLSIYGVYFCLYMIFLRLFAFARSTFNSGGGQ